MNINKLIALICLIALPISVLAETVPYVQKGAPDHRVRHVKYVKDDVVVVHGIAGVATSIILNEDEVVKAWYAGDKSAWQLVHSENKVFIKPKTNKNPTTNIHIVTNKRDYILKMVLARSPFFKVVFNYPHEKHKQQKRDVIDRHLADALNPAKQSNKNIRYYAQGSKQIIPREIFDNGTTTFMRFGRDQEMPTIFKTNVLGLDRIANMKVSKEWLILPTVQKYWTLRLGHHTTRILNDVYKPSQASDTGTASNKVNRVLR